ncbi:hypothetical protein GTO10_02155 [Candidatus Saccharibacteria bacterium]|nr:hypothetical protein [Candidatus Saccharibacteria bacterium]
MLQVEKKDGQVVDFDKSKISSALTRVGLSGEEAGAVADKVEAWAPTAAEEEVIKTSAIRDKVLELITPEMAEEYKRFESQKAG